MANEDCSKLTRRDFLRFGAFAAMAIALQSVIPRNPVLERLPKEEPSQSYDEENFDIRAIYEILYHPMWYAERY